MKIGILNYSVGNFGSLHSAIQKTGLFAKVAKTPEEIRSRTFLILPGVGHHSFCVNNLKTCGSDLAVKKHFNDKTDNWNMYRNAALLRKKRRG